jgi:hypothetical protein
MDNGAQQKAFWHLNFAKEESATSLRHGKVWMRSVNQGSFSGLMASSLSNHHQLGSYQLKT